jgi:hypothetical protein
MTVVDLLISAVRPLSLVILSSRSLPPALILASRFSRRRRACLCPGDSSASDMLGCSLAKQMASQEGFSDLGQFLMSGVVE